MIVVPVVRDLQQPVKVLKCPITPYSERPAHATDADEGGTEDVDPEFGRCIRGQHEREDRCDDGRKTAWPQRLLRASRTPAPALPQPHTIRPSRFSIAWRTSLSPIGSPAAPSTSRIAVRIAPIGSRSGGRLGDSHRACRLPPELHVGGRLLQVSRAVEGSRMRPLSALVGPTGLVRLPGPGGRLEGWHSVAGTLCRQEPSVEAAGRFRSWTSLGIP